MISKIGNSDLVVARTCKGKNAAATPKCPPNFGGEIPKVDYMVDFEKQKRNALNTSLAVIGCSMLFTAAYIFFSVIRNNRI